MSSRAKRLALPWNDGRIRPYARIQTHSSILVKRIFAAAWNASDQFAPRSQCPQPVFVNLRHHSAIAVGRPQFVFALQAKRDFHTESSSEPLRVVMRPDADDSRTFFPDLLDEEFAYSLDTDLDLDVAQGGR